MYNQYKDSPKQKKPDHLTVFVVATYFRSARHGQNICLLEHNPSCGAKLLQQSPLPLELTSQVYPCNFRPELPTFQRHHENKPHLLDFQNFQGEFPETNIFAPEPLESRRFLLGFPPSLGVKTVSFREGGTHLFYSFRKELLPAELGNFENTKTSGNALLLLLPALKGDGFSLQRLGKRPQTHRWLK